LGAVALFLLAFFLALVATVFVALAVGWGFRNWKG
jgi:hypothetical protein